MTDDALDLDGVEDAYPLTPAQSGMLFHTLSAPGTGIYIGCFDAGLPDTLDLDRFKAAWGAVARRHQTLRTVFVWDGLDAPVQVVLEDPPLQWEDARWPQDSEDQQALFEEAQQGGVALTRAPAARLIVYHADAGPRHFAWLCHHALIDAWSAEHILDEVTCAYADLGAGAKPVQEAAMPFRDFVDWTVSADTDAAKAYWLRTMGDYAEPAQIGLQAPESAAIAARTQGSVDINLETDTTARLLEAARTLRVTPTAVLNGLWGVVLHRLSGQDDVAFGLAVTQRPPELPGIETAVGNFVTTLPMRLSITANDSLGALIQNCHATLLDARQHGTLSIQDIRALTPLSGHGHFLETIVSVETRTEKSCEDGALFVRPTGRDRSHFPLSVILTLGDRTHGKVLYDTHRFTPPQAARVAGMLAEAMRVFSSQLEEPPTALGVMTPADAEAAAQGLAGPPLGPHALVLEDILSHAARAPNRIALLGDGAEMSYGALDTLSKAWAQTLQAHGVTPGHRVALYMQRDPMAIVGMLAILRAGCCYVPVNAAHPSGRTDDILTSCGAAAVLTRSPFAARAEALGLPVIDLDKTQPPATPSQDDGSALAEIKPDDTAYVIYTSGSTGQPKGVIVSHENLAASTAARSRFYPQAPDAFLLLSSIEFDSSVVGIYWTLTRGGTLVLPAQGEEQDVATLAAYIGTHQVTDLLCLPSLLELLFLYAPADRLTSLRTAISAGEALTRSCHAAWQSGAPHVRLYNEYGPSEATVWCVACEVDKTQTTHRAPIGAPVPGYTLYIRDAHRRPVPQGVPGELWVGGAGVSQGYLDQADLTNDRFVSDPAAPGMRLYRTGDLVRLRTDGMLDYLGRMDHQVKVRGHRVELGEIEAILSERTEIRSAAVTPYTAGQDTQLAAFVVLEHGAHLAVDALRDALRASLPNWMVPQRFVMLADMPQTATGKIDRTALVLPAEDGQRAFTPPRTDLERELAAIWKEVLWLDRDIGIDEDFTDLGGHSLLSIRMVSEIEARLGKRLPLSRIGRLTTIAAQARQIEEAGDRTEPAPAVPADPTSASGLFAGLDTDQLSQMHAYMAGWPGEPVWDGSLYRGLNTTGSLPPLFWCFNWGKEFAALAKELGPDQPLYGTRSGHLVLDITPDTQQWDNRRVAMQSVEELVKIQPHGPYYVGGNCQGAAVAMETAQVLHGLARPVGLVLMMEAVTEHAFHGPVALIFGDRSDMNPYALEQDPDAIWRERYLRYSVDTIRGRHGQFFNDRNIKQVSHAVATRLADARNAAETAKIAAPEPDSPSPPTGDSGTPVAQAVAALLNEALALASAEAIEAAVEVVRAALKIEPESFAALKQLGLLYAQEGDIAQADRVIRQALGLRDDPLLHVALANIEKQAKAQGPLRYKLRSNLRRFTGRP